MMRWMQHVDGRWGVVGPMSDLITAATDSARRRVLVEKRAMVSDLRVGQDTVRVLEPVQYELGLDPHEGVAWYWDQRVSVARWQRA